MTAVLKVLSGPLKGQTFALKKGLSIGRKGTTVELLGDARVSSFHALVEFDEAKQQLVLIDQNSKNGVRVNGDRVGRINLQNETTFSVGDTHFEVVMEVAVKKEPVPEPPVVVEPLVVMEPPRAVAKAPSSGRLWNDILAQFLEKNLQHLVDESVTLTPLRPALVLDFVKGVQVTQKWTLGFGPRAIGSESLDLPIWEPGAPDICFQVVPRPEGILYQTSFKSVVLLNGAPVERQILRAGDRIDIHDTRIDVDFTE